MEKKYRLTEETTVYRGHTLHRIQALEDFGNVNKGDRGGWVEKEANLSQEGDCWVYDHARVFGNALVHGSARVYGHAWVHGGAWVYENARVCVAADVEAKSRICGDAVVKQMGDCIAIQNWWSSGRWLTYTKSNGKWKVGCFYGSGDELIAKAYADSEQKGRCYEAIVNAVEKINSIL